MRDSAFIAVLAWLMYALSFYGIFVRSSKLRDSATRTAKQLSPPNFSRFFCTAWLVYVIIFNYLANLHFQPLFVGIQARFYMQPNLLVTASSALMLFQMYRWLPLSHALVRFSVPAILALSAWQVGRTFPTVNHRCVAPISHGRSLVSLNSRGLLQQRLRSVRLRQGPVGLHAPALSAHNTGRPAAQQRQVLVALKLGLPRHGLTRRVSDICNRAKTTAVTSLSWDSRFCLTPGITACFVHCRLLRIT